jgi:3-hydroxybutyryl-CoA dehydrogenase
MTVDDALLDPVVARVGRPFAIEAVRMLQASEGTVADIDAALEAAGFAIGPFRRLDRIGLDADLAIDRWLQAQEPASTRFDPPALQLALVEQGRLGQASARGFYRYHEAGPPTPDVTAGPGRQLSVDAIVERLQLAIINEAYRVVEDGIATPPAIDRAMRAEGHPRGPFEVVDGMGLRLIIDRLAAIDDQTAGRSGDQYLVAPALWRMATV